MTAAAVALPMTLMWAILALFLGLLLAASEVFIPSGGILGVLAAACLLLSVILAFTGEDGSTARGLVFLLTICVLLPVALGIAFHYWPRSPLGKHLFLTTPTKEEISPLTEHEKRLQALRGQIGKTITALRPAGMTDFDGRRVDTVTEGVMIGQGELVRVIEVHGNRVVVRRVEDGEATGEPIDFTSPLS